MAEHNFERRVRQEMSDLKIDPSDAVWENVKIRIEKKKDRRLFFILFFLLGLLLLGSGYFILYSPQPLKTSETTFNVDKEKKSIEPGIESSSKNSSSQKSGEKEDNISSSRIDNTTPLKQVAPTPIKTGNNAINNIVAKSKDSEILSLKVKPIKKEIDVTISRVPLKQDDEIKDDQNNRNAIQSLQPVMSTSVNKEADSLKVTTSIIKAEQNNDTAKDEVVTKADILNDTISISLNNKINDTSMAIAKSIKTKPSSSKNKWHIGLNIGGGISHVGNSIFASDKALSYDYFGAVQNSGSNSNPGNYYGRITPLSPVNSSGAYSIGLFIQRELSSKANFSAGINYTNFAVSTLEGSSYDSLQLRFSGNVNKSYRNNFNFIEVPLEVKLQLGRGKKMPVYWHGGISLNTLISSNALQYKPDTAGSYYTDNSLFNKIQIGINTGLSIQLFKIKSRPVTFGPYFYYGLTGLAKEGLYNRQHLKLAGLRTQFLFKRK